MKKLLFILMIIFLFIFSCLPTATNFKLSLTDAPADDNFEEIWVDFGSVETCYNDNSGEGKSENEEDEDNECSWISINSDGGKFNLLELNNGKIEELGAVDLTPGTYNQIRIYVNSVMAKVDGQEYDIKLASNTIKLVKSFTIKEGITTELVADFNAAKSIKKTGGGTEYLMTPVIRLVSTDTTGAIKGKVEPIEGVTITVSAYKDTEEIAGTVCDEEGSFIIGYLEPDIYDVVVEAVDYTSQTIEEKTVEAGKTLEITDIISLSQ